MTRRKTARAAKPRRPAPAKAVYTPAVSPRAPWATQASRVALGRLSAIASGHRPPDAPSAAPPDWWHTALAARDEAELHVLRNATHGNNMTVAVLAEMHSIPTIERAASAATPHGTVHRASVLQFDANELLAQLQAEAAKRKSGRGRARGANRWVAYTCPVCSEQKTKPDGTTQHTNTIRCSAADRLILCAGRADAEHAPAVCHLVQESVPAYRLADTYGHGEYSEDGAHEHGGPLIPETTAHGATGGTRGTHSRSQAQIASRKAKYAESIAAKTASGKPLTLAEAKHVRATNEAERLETARAADEIPF